MATLYDAVGAAVVTGREIGRGREGAVVELPNEPELVAKVYHEAISRDKQIKLTTMCTLALPAITKVAAWPLRTIHATRGGPVVGFVMPSVSSWPSIHSFYSPAERKRRFPELRWSFLIHAARNTAFAFETLHRHGIIVGDVNQSNVAVNPKKAEVRIVDCDSFQINAHGMTHLCEVGIDHFTPPELQNLTFHSVVRTENHDAFGLAVLCFHMLFMGRHPFAGRFLGSADMPIERAIREHRFAYGVMAQQRQMLPPPDTLPFVCVGPELTKLFATAFDHSSQSQRPAPAEWLAALETLERNLRRCASEPAHEYHGGVTTCPWCDLETRSVFYFIGRLTRRATTRMFDLAAAWAAIMRVPRPAPPTLPTSVPAASVSRSLIVRWRRSVGSAPAFAVLAVAIVLALTGSYGLVVAAVLCLTYIAARYGSREDRDLRAAIHSLEARWRDVAGRVAAAARPGPFENKLAELQRSHDEYVRLLKEQERELAQLEASKRESQLRAYLERFRIDVGRITGIGPGRAATLASYGIETAADLDWWRIQAVPGFGDKRTRDLMSWRMSLGAKFVFNANKQVPEAAKAAVRKKFERQLEMLQALLQSGADFLEAIRRDVSRSRETLVSEGANIASELSRVKTAISFRSPNLIPLPQIKPTPPAASAPRPAPLTPAVPRLTQPAAGGSNLTCPRCGKALLPRRGRHGPFWGCSGYPHCRYTRNR